MGLIGPMGRPAERWETNVTSEQRLWRSGHAHPVEDAIDRFEDAWQQGGRPVIDDYLTGDNGDLLVELVHVDLEYRLKAGEPARVEDYLSRRPELERDRQTLLDLLASEWRLRLRRDPSVQGRRIRRAVPGLPG